MAAARIIAVRLQRRWLRLRTHPGMRSKRFVNPDRG